MQQLEMRARRLVGILALAAAPLAASAQVAAPREEPNCTYQTCALGLAPVWDGLAVVRGEPERRIATLGFFVPGDMSEVFKDDADALDAAREAVRIRRIGAIMTDAGLVLAATGLARALFQRDFDKLSGALTIAGGLSLGASIPVQFAADGYLSRAVWLYNRRYSR